jgi:hypothetical protein
VRIYVETNFVLTLTLEQDGLDECTRILDLANNHVVELVLPSFALYEANFSIEGKRRRREEVRRDLESELREIQRSREFSGSTALSASFMEILVASTGNAEMRFRDVSQRLLTAARLLPLNTEVIGRGLEYFTQPPPDLSFPDAMVYATIMSDPELGATPSCFVTTNRKDFGNPDIIEPLMARDCKTLFTFDDALRYATSPNRV